MSAESRIDIIYISGDNAVVNRNWHLGQQFVLPYAPADFRMKLNAYLAKTSAEWVLLWDDNFGEPDVALLTILASKPVDAWHGGLRAGLAGKPDVLNYVQPTWMYNKDASEDIEHTSFRLSLGATLIRSSVLRQTMPVGGYESAGMFGLALGYKILKRGGVIRYHRGILKANLVARDIPGKDEWVFAKEFFPLKWQVWALLNKEGSAKNIKSWLAIESFAPQTNRPLLHSSKKRNGDIPKATVSVLAPTLNRYSYLAAELEQLSLQTIIPYEILITDQTDEKDRQPVDKAKYPRLNIRYFPQHEKGQCIAWNKMLEEAKGEYVLFLGDDADDIKPDFIEQLLLTMQRFNAGMVASNVIEAGIKYGPLNEHYSLADTFPITLIRKSLLDETGFLDMFFNKNIRADHDLAMRCHLKGALMIFNPSATIFHHRAPVGGLRTHNARNVTSNMVKNSVNKFLNPTSSEIYLVKKYYNPLQVHNYVKIKYLNQLFVKGGFLKKITRLAFFIASLPSFRKNFRQNEQLAITELNKHSPLLQNERVTAY